MNFREKELINGVYKFNIFNQNLFYIDINTNLIFDNEVKANNIISFNFQNDFIEFYNTSKITTILNLKSKKVDFVNGAIINDSKSDIDFLVSNYKNGQYEITSYNIIDNHFNKIKELQTKINFGSSIRYLDYFIFQNNIQGVSILSLLTGEYTWQSNLETFGEIRKILGVCEDLLWLTTMTVDQNRNSKAHLLALNINYGQIIHHLSDGLPLDEVHIKLLEEKQTIVSCWGKISSHGPAESPFVEINAKTGEVIRNSFSHSLFNANFKLGKWKFLNNKFYFTAAQDSISSSHIGIMDYETLELLWITKVANQKGAFRDLQVIENKIYVLDNGNQLHIYEKE